MSDVDHGGVDPFVGDRVTPSRGRADRVRFGASAEHANPQPKHAPLPDRRPGPLDPPRQGSFTKGTRWRWPGSGAGRRMMRPAGPETDLALPPQVQCQLPRLPTTWAVGTDRPTAQGSAVQLAVRCAEPGADAPADVVACPARPAARAAPNASSRSAVPGTPGLFWVNSCPPVVVKPGGGSMPWRTSSWASRR